MRLSPRQHSVCFSWFALPSCLAAGPAARDPGSHNSVVPDSGLPNRVSSGHSTPNFRVNPWKTGRKIESRQTVREYGIPRDVQQAVSGAHLTATDSSKQNRLFPNLPNIGDIKNLLVVIYSRMLDHFQAKKNGERPGAGAWESECLGVNAGAEETARELRRPPGGHPSFAIFHPSHEPGRYIGGCLARFL